VSEAEREARAIVNQSYADKQAVESEVAVFGNLEEDLRFKFQSLLEGYLQQLDELDLTAQQWQCDPSSENSEATAAEHTTDSGRTPTTLGDPSVAEPWRSALEPAIAIAPAVATPPGAARARVPIALLTATTGEALAPAQVLDEADGESESTSSEELESQPEPKRPKGRLGRLGLRRRRAPKPKNGDDLDAHGIEGDDDLVAVAMADESSDDAAA